MEEMHISEIPYEVADDATFFKVPVHKETFFELLSPDAVVDPPENEVKTYRIVRGPKLCQP